MNEMTREASAKDEVHWLDYLLVLVKHSRAIIYPTVAAMVLAYSVLFISHDEFTASASLLPPQQNFNLSAQLLDIIGGGITPGSATSGGGGLGGGLGGLLGLKSPGDLYVGMMNSNTITDHIIDRFNLRQEYDAKTIEAARKTLRDATQIKTDKDGLIKVEVKALTPKQAAAIANAYIDELDKLLQVIGVDEAKNRLAFLEKERQQANINLGKGEEALRNFSEQKSVVQIDTQTKGMLEYIANLRASIDAKEVQIEVLRKQATPYNYDVIRLETELKSLKEKVKGAETQMDQSCIGDVCLPTSKVPSLGLEYFRLYREVKFQAALYELYTKLVEFARLDMVKDVAVVQMVDRAKPPEKRSNSRMLPTILMGAGTFFLMLLVAFGREYIENLKANEEDARRLLMLSDCLQSYANSFNRLKQLVRLKKTR
jgi:capsule polysaccharide export protein KpsE/RkpR